MLGVNPSRPWKTLPELIANTKANPAKGSYACTSAIVTHTLVDMDRRSGPGPLSALQCLQPNRPG